MFLNIYILEESGYRWWCNLNRTPAWRRVW